MRRALAIAGWILFGAVAGAQWGYAADETRHMMARVERALVLAGYTKALGYAQLPPPAVVYAETVSGGGWGSYRLGVIEISSRQPAGCIPITLAHEVSHDLMVRMGIIDTVPTHDVMRELERAARIAEASVSADDWAPNCVMRGAL